MGSSRGIDSLSYLLIKTILFLEALLIEKLLLEFDICRAWPLLAWDLWLLSMSVFFEISFTINVELAVLS